MGPCNLFPTEIVDAVMRVPLLDSVTEDVKSIESE